MNPIAESRALNRTLRKTFGFNKLRAGQEEVIASVMAGGDTLAIMPTGAGKSLCYQLPALHLPGVTIVVSPLIALMKDQADKLTVAGVPAVGINSTLNRQDEAAAYHTIAEAGNEFIFATPERLTDEDFLARLQEHPVDLFVVDEAHCISQWGHDFRPAFLALANAIDVLGRPPILALTATATDRVIEDIARQLKLSDLTVINTGIHRPNLHYQVVHVTNEEEKRAAVVRLVEETEGTGIVYTATVKAAEAVHAALIEAGIDAVLYHGRLPNAERTRNQEAFMQGHHRVMVATNAFGMGIDKADIRYVIHHQMPGKLEAYYQEAGRAGRDGAPARCVLLYDLADKRVQQFFLARRYPGAEEISRVYAALKRGDGGVRAIDFTELREQLPAVPANKLQVALKLLADAGIVVEEAGHSLRLAITDASRKSLNALAREYGRRAQHDAQMLERMIGYAQSGSCRARILLDYFGETADWQGCGACDNCRQPPAPATTVKPAAKPVDKPISIAAFHAGDPVSVPKYGAGRVVSAAVDRIMVAFSSGKPKAFLPDYVERRAE